ncbi:unnamed protein product, partial [Prorocentrum cordatum]
MAAATSGCSAQGCSAPSLSTAAPGSCADDGAMPFAPPMVAEDIIPLTPPMGAEDEDAIPFAPPMEESAEERGGFAERRGVAAAATTPPNDLGDFEGFGDGVDSEDMDYYDNQDWEWM